jgi:hypothetical protein
VTTKAQGTVEFVQSAHFQKIARYEIASCAVAICLTRQRKVLIE